MLEFAAFLVGLALLWQLRRTDFGKAMFVLLGICALLLVIGIGAETIRAIWQQPPPAAVPRSQFDPDKWLKEHPGRNPFDQFDVHPAGLPPGFAIENPAKGTLDDL